MKIGNREIGYGKPVYVIAEAGIAHGGNPDAAKQMAINAKWAGADAVKFQMLRVDSLYSAECADLKEKMRQYELSAAQWADLKAYCHEEIGITFLVTAHDEQSLDELIMLDPPAYKIGSGEVGNLPFIERIASQGKPVILSTGMYQMEQDLAETIEVIHAAGCRDHDLAIMHCVSAYPTPDEDVDMGGVMMTSIDGYSDHTPDSLACIAAAALGATIIEKHLDWSGSPDSAVSINANEFKRMIEQIRRVEKMIGNNAKFHDLPAARKSLVARQEIQAGAVMAREMLTAKRPGTGIPPSQIESVIGRRTAKKIHTDFVIREEDLVH